MSRVPGPDRAKGPGPGPFGPGARAGTPWARGPGAPGPKMWDTHGKCIHLLPGKLPTVRQATYCQAKLPTVRQATYSQAKLPTVRHAPNNRIHAPNRAIDMHPKGIDMHPKVSIDLHPTSAYFAPNGEGSIFKKYNIQLFPK